MSSPPQRWYCACGANNPPTRAECFRCGTAPPAAARKRTRGRAGRRTPNWVAALPIGLATLFLLFVLFRAGSDAASPILAKQVRPESTVETLPARPEARPAAPGALMALPQRQKPAPPAPAARPSRRAPDLPDAPSMLTAPQAPPQVATAPVVQAPAVPIAPAAPPVPAPSLMAASVKPSAPEPPVTSAPARPAEGPGVTNAQGWKETPIQQERPVVRIYNTAGDDGRSQVFLTDGRARFRVSIENPYGEVTLPPGSYRYELYASGSAAAPNPDQVGVLRCRKYTQYSLEYFRTPFARTRQRDLGDERPDTP